MNEVIHLYYDIPLTPDVCFQYFTEPHLVKSWLAEDAHIVLHEGGEYSLYWDLENRDINNTKGCVITAYKKSSLIGFTWKGAHQFDHFMNHHDPLTHVTITFIDTPDHHTEVHLIHTGWVDRSDWKEARLWFEAAWKKAFNRLLMNITSQMR